MPEEAIFRESMFAGNTAAFSELASYVSQGHVIGFTGAGVSAPVFPTWTELLSRLLNEATDKGLIASNAELSEYKKLIRSDPLELASSLEEIFTKEVFRARLADVFRNSASTPSECHTKLAEIGLRGIVTLNYDNGHEVAHASSKSRPPNVGRGHEEATITRWLQHSIFSDAEPPILHFHGDVSEPHQMVITGDDYDKFYASPLSETLVVTLWRTSRLLVIGFGFSDPFFVRIAERTLRSLPSENRHYAFIGVRPTETVLPMHRRIFAKKYRLTPVFYEVRQHIDDNDNITEDHSDLSKLIGYLHKCTSSSQAPTDGSITRELVVRGETSPSTPQILTNARREFEQDLFVTPAGKLLYAEPRLSEHVEIDLSSIRDATLAVKTSFLATSPT
jgi:hypothetical protein